MRLIPAIGISVLAALYITWEDPPDPPPVDSERGTNFKSAFSDSCVNGVCVIPRNGGGLQVTFQRAAYEVLEGYADRIVIDVPCYSACVLFADLARERVCLTPKARMFLHKARARSSMELLGMQLDWTHYADPPHSLDISQWVYKTHGGFPKEGFVEMDNRAKAQFWRACSDEKKVEVKKEVKEAKVESVFIPYFVQVPLPRSNPRR